MRRGIGLLVLTALLAGSNPTAHGAYVPVTFATSGTSADGRAVSAAADFSLLGTGTSGDPYRLQIVLRNTYNPLGPLDKLTPGEVLTGIFFDVVPGVNNTPGSGTVASGSGYVFGDTAKPLKLSPTDSKYYNIGGEWLYGYKSGGLSKDVTPEYGLSTVGLSLPWKGVLDPSAPNLDGSKYNGATDFGFVSQSYVDNTSWVDGLDKRVLIASAGVFTLTLSGTYDSPPLTSVTNVRFQYGTDLRLLDGEEVTVVPAPPAAVLLLTAVPAVLLRRRFCRVPVAA